MHPLYGLKQRNLGGTRRSGSPRRLPAGTMRAAVVPPPDAPAGKRFSYWLGQRAKDLREMNGHSLEAVAAYVGMSKESIDRFEKGLSRPHEEGGIVASYAAMCDVADPRDIYAEALRGWYQHGEPPVPKRPQAGGAAAA